MKPVYVKESFREVGVGSKACQRLWESEPNDEGAFAHVARDEHGNYYISTTDMENFDGSYASIWLEKDDLYRLMRVLFDLYEEEESPNDRA